MSAGAGLGPKELARFDADKERRGKPDCYEALRAANVAVHGFPTGTRVRITGAHNGRWAGRYGVVAKVPCLAGLDFRYVAMERTARERTDHTQLIHVASLKVLCLHCGVPLGTLANAGGTCGCEAAL